MQRGFASDRGSAVVDFVLMMALLIFLLFGVLQVAVYVYARNIVSAAAADGARYAANAGADPAAGGVRADTLIRGGLGSNTADALRCGGELARDSGSPLAVATVRCRGELPLLFLPLSSPLSIDISASSLREGAP